MKFNNTPNKSYEVNGKTIWASRSCAVVSIVTTSVNGMPYVLLGKRGQGTPDFQGHWCLPCGYIDYDENAYDAARRETWEETGLDLVGSGFHGNEKPWDVKSNPGESTLQNISLYFTFLKEGKELDTLSIDHCEPDEVDEAKWFTFDEVREMKLAFNHNEALDLYCKAYGC